MKFLDRIDEIIFEQKLPYDKIFDLMDQDNINMLYKKYISNATTTITEKKTKLKSLYTDLLKDELSRTELLEILNNKNNKLKNIIFIDGTFFYEQNFIDVDKFNTGEFHIIFLGHGLQPNSIKYFYKYSWFSLILIRDVKDYNLTIDLYISYYSGLLDVIFPNVNVTFNYITESSVYFEIKRTLEFWSGRQCNLIDILNI